MRETLVKLENFLNELGASDLLSQVPLTAMVTLMVENFFSLMRKDDPMPTQFEYETRRATCVRELQKRMYRGHFHYYTGPKSYYPDKVINCRRPPVNDDLKSEMNHQMERLTLEDKRQLREFSSTFGTSVRQHTVRDKSKEETGCLLYAVSLDLQRREPGSTVPHTSFLGESASSEATDNPLTVQLQDEVLFATRDVVSVKHARRREQFSFFLAMVMKDLLVNSTSATELEFAEETVDFLWLGNSNSDNSLIFQDTYRDNKNSPYSIIDKVDIYVSTNDSGITLYELPKSKVDRIERNLQGGTDSDIDGDNDSTSEEEDDRPPRECYNSRNSRAATRLRLS